MPRIMRSLLLGSIPLIWVASALPQASIPSEKEDDLYAIALAASVREMQKSWGEIDDSDKGRIRTDYHHLLVRKNPEITDDRPRTSVLITSGI